MARINPKVIKQLAELLDKNEEQIEIIIVDDKTEEVLQTINESSDATIKVRIRI